MDDLTNPTRTAPGHLAARATLPATPLRLAEGTRVTPLTAPRLALMAQPQRTQPKSETVTSIFAQWQSADRIDGGGKSLIREIEG